MFDEMSAIKCEIYDQLTYLTLTLTIKPNPNPIPNLLPPHNCRICVNKQQRN